MSDSITTSEDDDLYYFESDHLALKGNRDYSEVIKTLFILCAQRKQAIEDYKKAVKLKEDALDDPIKVLEKIMNGESLNMPDKLRIPELPIIDWSKYNVKIPENILREIYSDSGGGGGGGGNVELTKRKETLKKEKCSNRKWSLEEQKRLEELLQIYPPEPVEMKRFKKIADALGNRSVQQVTSRVQKYFLKLYKAGLPIPGRVPKTAERNRKSALHKHQRHNHYLWKPSTFFPDLCLPVTRSELHDDLPSSMPLQLPDDPTSQQPSTSNYLLTNPYSEENSLDNNSTTTPKTDTELQLELLKRIKIIKVKENETPTTVRHFGFKCDYCNDEPILGTRWHCITCNYDSIDFCTDCVLSQLYSENRHPLTHILNPYNDEIEMDLSDDMESNSDSESRNNDDDDDNDDDDGNDSDNNSESNDDIDNDEECVETTTQQINVNNNENLVNNEFFNEIDNISYDYLHTNLLLNE